MRTAIIQISEAGKTIAAVLQKELQAEQICRTDVPLFWDKVDAFVFIGAMGICVRTIAPLVADKHTDPAVVCIDSTGRHAISVLSGHIGGANDLAQIVASAIGADPVVTTQSDNTGLWALDTFERRFGWQLVDSSSMQQVIINFVNGKPTALVLGIRDEGTDWLETTLPDHVTMIEEADWQDEHAADFSSVIVVSPLRMVGQTAVPQLHFVPKVLTMGIGLAHQASPVDEIVMAMKQQLLNHNLEPAAVRTYATIDVKADEPVVHCLQQHAEVQFFTAEQLSTVDVPTPSSVVQQHVGTPSVSEAAAILATQGGQMLMTKQKGQQYTCAIAMEKRYERQRRRGHIEIVGAGPGDPDLVSVRGRKMLEQADLILYAGSLVPRELTLCHKSGAVVRSSASMALEEQCQLMKEFYEKGKFVVRLHTGDPCIFGAIQEQMAFFDREGMSYHITPGISSFLAAAAELRSQFTIPECTQTIILTRGEGRTPMPEREKLHLLARSQSTMCIFLSAAIVDDVQRELLEEYPENTPVAACYHLTWPDQRIYRGRLKDLANIVHDNDLTLTTMLVVGEAIDNRRGLSELYNRHFTHLFRRGE